MTIPRLWSSEMTDQLIHHIGQPVSELRLITVVRGCDPSDVRKRLGDELHNHQNKPEHLRIECRIDFAGGLRLPHASDIPHIKSSAALLEVEDVLCAMLKGLPGD